MALHLNKKTVLALLLAVALIAAAVYLTLLVAFPKPPTTLVTHYQCTDGSYYLVVDNGDEILISGHTFALVPESNPRRYAGAGDMEFEIQNEVLNVKNIREDSITARCAAQAPEVDFVNTL